MPLFPGRGCDGLCDGLHFLHPIRRPPAASPVMRHQAASDGFRVQHGVGIAEDQDVPVAATVQAAARFDGGHLAAAFGTGGGVQYPGKVAASRPPCSSVEPSVTTTSCRRGAPGNPDGEAVARFYRR
ncbi:MAG: hypothetical protein MZV64_01715 [Ignavibacteriales bacterium]|nr:hypothetical protein [Ignavibacteriales bacterium]